MPFLIVLTNSLVQVLKLADPEEKFNRFYPLLALGIGLGLGLYAGEGLILSLMIGPSAIGIYRGAKVLIKGE